MKVLVTGGSGFIGSYLCQVLEGNGHKVFNVDVVPPVNHDSAQWFECSVLDKSLLENIFQTIQPEFVFHLAAKADVFGETIEDYRVNSEGTKNILLSCNGMSSLKHVVVVSTQMVVRPQYRAAFDSDYCPLDELYSRSKVEAEELVRRSEYSFDWTIVRPTNIWGAGHPRFPDQIWKYIYKGWYFHTSKDVVRSYGYVENVAYQMSRIMDVPLEKVKGKTFYVGDEPIFSSEWVNGFSIALRGKEVKRFPDIFLKIAAILGEIFKKCGLPSPIYMDRYRSMTSEYVVPMDETLSVLGSGHYSLHEGIMKTVSWLKHRV